MFDAVLFAVLGVALLLWAGSLSDYATKSFGDAPVVRSFKSVFFATWFLRLAGIGWIVLAAFALSGF